MNHKTNMTDSERDLFYSNRVAIMGWTRVLVVLLWVLLAIGIAKSFTGCAVIGPWAERNEEGLRATGQFVAQKAGQIALWVLRSAVSYRDASGKADYVDGLASAFRTIDYRDAVSVTGEDIRKLVAAWTPDKSHWNKAGDRFAELWQAHPPKTRREAEVFIEALAEGLNAAAYKSRQNALETVIVDLGGRMT